jgi:hypothetical protein
MPKLLMLAKEGHKDAKREYYWQFVSHFMLTFYLHSLKERILAAGYDSADIDSIGMSAVPGANVNKVLTEEGVSRVTP